MRLLKFLLPDGEHLCLRVARLLKRSGYGIPDYGAGKRIYNPKINIKHFRITVRRPLQIANELSRGEADAGITGLDCIREFPGSIPLLDLEEPVTKFVLTVPNAQEFDHIEGLETFINYICPGGVTIWSEYPHFVQQYFADHPAYRSRYKHPPGLDLAWQVVPSESPVVVRLSLGATEGNRFFADTTQTYTTIIINKGRIIHTLLERSTPWLVASNHALADPYKRVEIMELKSRLKAVIDAEHKSKRQKVSRQSRSIVLEKALSKSHSSNRNKNHAIQSDPRYRYRSEP
jgi:ATP phosphoribosyltransferase